jgi:hypothetical protein
LPGEEHFPCSGSHPVLHMAVVAKNNKKSDVHLVRK